MKNVIVSVVCALGFSGCVGIFSGLEYKPENTREIVEFHRGAYKDVKSLAGDIKAEKEKIESEGFTVK